MNVFIWYIFPQTNLALTLNEILRYRYLFGLDILILSIFNIILVVKLFVSNRNNGNDLLLITKMVNRTKLIWSKLLTLITFILLVSGINAFIVSFIKISGNDVNCVANYIILGNFVAPVICGLVFSSLTLLFSVFSKELTTILLVAGIETILFCIQLVCNFVVQSPGVNLFNGKNIRLVNNNIISKIQSDKPINLHQTTLAEYKYVPINLETEIGGNKLKYRYKNLNQFANDVWNKENKNQNLKLANYISFQTQWTNLFGFYLPNYLNQLGFMVDVDGNSYTKRMQTSGNEGLYWSIQFDNLGYKDILNNYNVESLNITSNDIKKNFVLTTNNGLVLLNYHISSKLNTLLSNQNYELNWTIESINDDLVFPIFEIDETTQNFKLHKFNNLNEFANYYFSQQLANNYEYMNCVNKIKKLIDYNSVDSYYYTLLTSYWYKNENVQTSELKNHKVIPKLYSLWQWTNKFQLTVYKFLNEYFNNFQPEYDWVKNHGLNEMLNVFNVGNINNYQFNFNGNKTVYLGTPYELKQALIASPNLNVGDDYKWWKLQPFFSLNDVDTLQTMTIAKQIPIIDNNIVVITWLIASVFIYTIGINLYLRKDFA